jgi:hypothetical protein
VSRSRSDREKRRSEAEMLYELEMVFREEGTSKLVYDEAQDLFRFPDGKFAISKEWADIKLLEKRGFFG